MLAESTSGTGSMGALAPGTNDHTLSYRSWERYKTYQQRLESWALTTGVSIEFKSGTIEGKEIQYPVLLDASGEPMVEMATAFLVWLNDQPDLPKKDPYKFALKYLQASANMERNQRKLPILDGGAFNTYMEGRVAAKEQRRAAGVASTSACDDHSTRADHLPTFDEKLQMMHLAYEGDARIHENPLRAMQTGVEMLITHVTGVRGEKVRTATFAHVWPRPYSDLAGGEGIVGTVFHNTRKGKTNEEGEATHAGWVPSKNVLLDIDGGLGTCLLYRISRREAFPKVCANLDGKRPGYQYKWLPLIKNTDGSHELNATKALLSIRPLGPKPQNAAWNKLFNAAGVGMYKGDSVTHGGRAACNQEFREAGGNPTVSDEALGYTHDVSKDHYAPQIPLQFALQRGHYGLLEGAHFAEADAAHLRAGRHAAADPLRQLVDIAVPELPHEEKIVAAINTTASDPRSINSVMQQKAINATTHKREHENCLKIIRHQLSMAFLNAAARPRKRDGTVDYDAKSLIEQHGSGPVYGAIRKRDDGSWLFDHPLFEEVAAAVRNEEERERSLVVASPSRQKTAQTAAMMVVGAVGPQLDRIEKKTEEANVPRLQRLQEGVDSVPAATASALAPAMEHQSAALDQRALDEAARAWCEELRKQDGGLGWGAAAVELGRCEPTQELATEMFGTTVMDRIDPRWQLVAAEQLRREYKRYVAEIQRADAFKAARAAQRLRSAPAPCATSLAPSTCSAATLPFPSSTPTPLAIKSVASSVSSTKLLDGPGKKRKRRDDGNGLPHASFTELGSIEALWNEYVGSDGKGGLRQRAVDNVKWYGEGPDNKASRQLWYDKLTYYREIARQALVLDSLPDAIAAVQERLNQHKKPGRGGWQNLLKVLETEQPTGEKRDSLTRQLKELSTDR